ncbi:glucosamine-6-phosphate deaminase NagB-II [Alteromonas sp. ASW11-130]|uniref:glucosamine-6-phosphate deaminase NagB-II n=1 Tax=Alteromonas sp. ASW11-130 TaxID=3015775 RepID=UPI002242B57C|nr:SIS domain-containing protein [Alteromonas sp. ASW11-130]MCW8092315.1 SIS domain-containing protein [Alteromonas sp. ASW11-130]
MTFSMLAREARQAPQVIQRQLQQNAPICTELVKQINKRPITMVCIIGRGSSDHAGVFAKYLIEVELGLPVCSAAPSVSTVFNRQLKLKNALVICISQSGQSPDIIRQAEAARNSGAYCVALVNNQTSPLAEVVHATLPLHAGEEKAVAATKSYLATLSALIQLTAYWSQNEALIKDLKLLPGLLGQTIEAPSQLRLKDIQNVAHCVALGRSFGYAIGREIALKLKEVCGVQAEPFSSAEFLHGPVTLATKNLTAIDIRINDESAASHTSLMSDINAKGARSIQITHIPSQLNFRLLPLAVLQRFYIDIEAIATQMGRDPDRPTGLKKVTQTL